MEDEEDTGSDLYTLGEPAEDVYASLTTDREQTIDMARKMAELTIPSVFPPEAYKTGDDLPGNNQSVGAHAVNTLASKLYFMAFPPGQPIMKLKPVVTKLQPEIDKDPALYGKVLLALSQLEVQHRERFQSTPMATAYVGYMKLLLVAGNGLWKHIKLNSPTYHRHTDYVVSRARDGHPLLCIHKERVRVSTLPADVQAMIYEEDEELMKESEWLREADIYSVCELVTEGDDAEQGWRYWQEYKGRYIEGTGFETDYNDCPMWPGWLIPVYGSNWGRSYCEEYRGDLFTLEAHGSSINDIAALASWVLTFVKPGTRTSIRQVQKAENLSVLSGSAEDLSTFRSEKGADAQIVSGNFEQAARRIGAAFLVNSSVMRDGERVTREEVVRVGRELDQAMGGLYTEIAQGHQRRVLYRAVRLHEDENKDLPPIPDGVVELGVITGLDAISSTTEESNLTEWAANITGTFGPAGAAEIINPSEYASRLAAAKSVKPDGLVVSQDDIDAKRQQQMQQQMGASMIDKATGPMAGALAGALTQGAGEQPPTATGA